jgi:hypothetical protein
MKNFQPFAVKLWEMVISRPYERTNPTTVCDMRIS